MAYVSRNILDRIASGDDVFYMYPLEDGKVKLVPAPYSVTEPGTDINRELLQIIEDRVVWLMNRMDSNIAANPFNLTFNTLNGLEVTGVWNESQSRVEC